MTTIPRVFIALFSLLLLSACGPEYKADCSNGTCICEDGHDCELECESPPCHTICADNGTVCEAECANGECTCKDGAVCLFDCEAPPCHVNCIDTPECIGVCANGDCNCSAGSNCTFDCTAGPCHVNCEGYHAYCNGVCANGTCNCGPASSCLFSCFDGDCGATCEAGSSCSLECPLGNAGSQGCRFEQCSAGEPLICPDGLMTTCGMACPVSDTDQ